MSLSRHIVPSLETTVSSKVLPNSSYNWFKYHGPDITASNDKGRTLTLHKADIYGIRRSTSGNQLRLVTKKQGPSKVFTCDVKLAKFITDSSRLTKAVARVQDNTFAQLECAVSIKDMGEHETLILTTIKGLLRSILHASFKVEPIKMPALSPKVLYFRVHEGVKAGFSHPSQNEIKEIARHAGWLVSLKEFPNRKKEFCIEHKLTSSILVKAAFIQDILCVTVALPLDFKG
jgi:hypothetical protein